jgi:hypothetical protein
MTSSAVFGKLSADTTVVVAGLPGDTVYSDLFAPLAFPEARKYSAWESPENLRLAAEAAPVGDTFVTVAGLAIFRM